MSERSYHGATSCSLEREIAQWVHPMKDRSDDPSHHERTLLPRSYISLLDSRNCENVRNLTLAESFRCSMAGSLTFFPDAFLVELIRSERAEATSFTAFINRTCGKKIGILIVPRGDLVDPTYLCLRLL